MIQAEDFITAASERGFKTWTGVPCSFLTPFINSVIDDPEMTYISSANEGDAVATATGAALAGQPAVAMMQNSGLGNAISPLSSLNWVFRIPILLIVTLRGEPGLPDEPQHELMGQITTDLLDKLQIPWAWFPRDVSDVEGALMLACWQMEKTARPYALVMRKGSVAPGQKPVAWQAKSVPVLDQNQAMTVVNPKMTRQQALELVVENTSDRETLVVGSTGYIGRELYSVNDRPNHLYMVGSMGCASSLGLGLSLALPQYRVVVLEGDGAALMRLGNFATIGAYGGENFQHVLLDNQVHESTGGQSTVSSAINFAALAAASGYASSTETYEAAELRNFLNRRSGPEMLHLHIKRGIASDLPRPDIGPVQVSRRLMRHFGIETEWGGSVE